MTQNEELNKQIQLATDLQFEMMGDMYNKMTSSCNQKCISTKYRESELSKGESVCIDRCVGKFLDIYEKIGKKINTMTMQEEQLNKASNSTSTS